MHHLIDAEQAKVPKPLLPFTSTESLIDQATSTLTAEIMAAGHEPTHEQLTDFHALNQSRANLMMRRY